MTALEKTERAFHAALDELERVKAERDAMANESATAYYDLELEHDTALATLAQRDAECAALREALRRLSMNEDDGWCWCDSDEKPSDGSHRGYCTATRQVVADTAAAADAYEQRIRAEERAACMKAVCLGCRSGWADGKSPIARHNEPMHVSPDGHSWIICAAHALRGGAQ